MAEGGLAKRVVAGFYSTIADNLYDPIIVRGTFRLLGGDLNALVLDQGRRAVGSAQGGPILDMPVGTGYFTREMARRHEGLVVGADIAWGMVLRTRRDAEQLGRTNLVTTQADAHRLPFRDGSFRVAICSNGLQVMPGLDATLAELARVVAPGGRLFVSILVAPLGSIVPGAARRHLPTIVRPPRDVGRAIEAAGFGTPTARRDRLATLFEATKL